MPVPCTKRLFGRSAIGISMVQGGYISGFLPGTRKWFPVVITMFPLGHER